MVTADVYVVVVAATQNRRAPPFGQSLSEEHPEALQNPAEQMLEGGAHSPSFEQATWHAPAAHWARGLLVDLMQSEFVMQPDGLHRLVVASQVLPDAQSRSLEHLK